MKKYVVAGNSLRDVIEGVEALAIAISMGATEGVGGSTPNEVAEGIEAMRKMTASTPAPTSTPTPCETDLLEALEDLDMEEIADELAVILTDAVADECAPLVELANHCCGAPLRDILTDRLVKTLPDLLSSIIQQCCDS